MREEKTETYQEWVGGQKYLRWVMEQMQHLCLGIEQAKRIAWLSVCVSFMAMALFGCLLFVGLTTG